MNIQGLDKAAVLAALYNRARPQGMGFLHYDPKPMTVEEAQKIIWGGDGYFDYLKGRVMKVDLSDNEVDTQSYNRDNGPQAAEEVIVALAKSGDTNPETTKQGHRASKQDAAAETRLGMTEKTTFNDGVVNLGLEDVIEHLGPAVDRAMHKEKKD